MSDHNIKRQKLFEQRKQQLSKLLGVPFEKIIGRFEADLLGCLSGGSNERDHARDWLLFCFHQYFGSGDYDNDEQKRDEVCTILQSFIEPTNQELETQ